MKKIFNWDNLIALCVVMVYISATSHLIFNAIHWQDVVVYVIITILIVGIFYLLKRFRFKNYPKFAKWILFFFVISILLLPYCRVKQRPYFFPISVFTYKPEIAKEINKNHVFTDVIAEFHDELYGTTPPSFKDINYIDKNLNKYFINLKNTEIEYRIDIFSYEEIAKIAQKYANNDSIYINLPHNYKDKYLNKEIKRLLHQYSAIISYIDGVKKVDIKLNNYNRVFRDSTIIVDIDCKKGADTKLIKSAVEKLLNSRDWKTQINLKEVNEK